MARGIGKRIKSLEALHGGEACEGCGFGGAPPAYEVVWHDHDESAEPKWCETCGRQVEFVVKWADIPDPKGAA